MIKHIFVALVGLVLAVAGAMHVSLGGTNGQVASNDVGQVSNFQKLSTDDNGCYAPSLEWLTSQPVPLSLKVGSTVSYRVSADCMGYVFAEQLPSGSIVVGGDQIRGSVTCTEYTPECIQQATADAGLISAEAIWQAAPVSPEVIAAIAVE